MTSTAFFKEYAAPFTVVETDPQEGYLIQDAKGQWIDPKELAAFLSSIGGEIDKLEDKLQEMRDTEINTKEQRWAKAED